MGEVEVSLHIFLNEEVHDPVTLFPGKESTKHMTGDWLGFKARSVPFGEDKDICSYQESNSDISGTNSVS
jgi:hypothetical protein